MNRRHFLGQVVLGSAVASSLSPRAVASEQSAGGLRIKFVGLMGYITRSDRSLLIAMPGHHPMGHYTHTPFLMARAGSPVAAALGLTPMPGVVAGAFDDRLQNEPPGAFVFRCLEGCDIEVDGGGGAVANHATQLAQMHRISGGKRLRNDLRRWSSATVTVAGGQLDNSAAHPDAGKVWSFGAHKQQLTDATMYSAAAGRVTIAAGADVAKYSPAPGEISELWVVSSAGTRSDVPDPKRLVHGEVLFQFFADAPAVVATCEEAEGRITVASDVPCAGGMTASRTVRAARSMPPHVDMCPGGGWCDPCI